MNYCIVHENSIEDLEESVNKKLRRGWVPVGGVHVLRVEYA